MDLLTLQAISSYSNDPILADVFHTKQSTSLSKSIKTEILHGLYKRRFIFLPESEIHVYIFLKLKL